MRKLLKAFTLIELLVAMAVMAVLVVLLLTLVDSASKLWRSNESRIDAYRESRVAISIISKDLQNSLVGSNLSHIRINTPDAYQRLPGEAVTDPVKGGVIFFLSAMPSGAQEVDNKSDVCEVGYFLAYGKSSATSGAGSGLGAAGLKDSMNLYRYFRSSDATFKNLTNNSLFSSNISLIGNEVELLARNVVSFVVTPYNTNAAGIPEQYNASVAAPAPEFVEIKVVAVNQETAKKTSSKSDWLTPAGGMTNVFGGNMQTFVSRVKLNNKP